MVGTVTVYLHIIKKMRFYRKLFFFKWNFSHLWVSVVHVLVQMVQDANRGGIGRVPALLYNNNERGENKAVMVVA